MEEPRIIDWPARKSVKRRKRRAITASAVNAAVAAYLARGGSITRLPPEPQLKFLRLTVRCKSGPSTVPLTDWLAYASVPGEGCDPEPPVSPHRFDPEHWDEQERKWEARERAGAVRGPGQ